MALLEKVEDPSVQRRERASPISRGSSCPLAPASNSSLKVSELVLAAHDVDFAFQVMTQTLKACALYSSVHIQYNKAADRHLSFVLLVLDDIQAQGVSAWRFLFVETLQITWLFDKKLK